MIINVLFYLIALVTVGAGSWIPVSIVSPTYPAIATQARIEGLVEMQLTLNKYGHVSSIRVLSGNKLLAESAKNNIKEWAFAIVCVGPPKGSTIHFTYDFKLKGTVNSRPGTYFRYSHPYKVLVTSEALHWNSANNKLQFH